MRVTKADFDVTVYKAKNADLQAAYGNNNRMYYVHYNMYGHNEKRTVL